MSPVGAVVKRQPDEYTLRERYRASQVDAPMQQLKIEAPVEYGSDRNGLVWGYRFEPGKPAVPVTSDQVAAELAATRDTGTFYWLHFSLANAGTERWLRQFTTMPEAFYSEFHTPSSATRVEQDDEALVAVINDVALDLQNDIADVSPVTLGVRPGLLISARRKPLRSIDRLREWVRSGLVCRSPVALLTRLLEYQALVLTEIVRKTNAQVDAIEDNVFTARTSGRNRAELSVLRRQLVRMQRLLAPEPAAMFRLLNRPPHWMHEDDSQEVRHSAEDFAAVVADCATLVERAKLIQEELTAMVNEQTNRSLFLLTVVTVMLLPFNVVGGLFGMNVEGIPFAKDPSGFWIVIFVVTVLTVLVGRVLARRFRR